MDIRSRLEKHFKESTDTKEKFAEDAGVGIATFYRYLAGDGMQTTTLTKIERQAEKLFNQKGGWEVEKMADDRLTEQLIKMNDFLAKELEDCKKVIANLQTELREAYSSSKKQTGDAATARKKGARAANQ